MTTHGLASTACYGNCDGSCCCEHVGRDFGVYPDGTTYSTKNCRHACRRHHWESEMERERVETKNLTHERRRARFWQRSYATDDYLLKRHGIKPLFGPGKKPYDRDGNKTPITHKPRDVMAGE
jgi:hypothetical protein